MRNERSRVLVLGGGGMLGHRLAAALAPRFDTWATVRGKASDYARFDILEPCRLMGDVDALNFERIVAVVGEIRPDAVINCIGILKQLPAAKDPIATLQVNSLFPQRLALLCKAAGAWLVHISTDCVFSGGRGNYTEEDTPDADDLYGRTKLLGEPAGDSVLVLRTSMIGRELQSRVGLAEWLIANRGKKVKGYRLARFTGLTTPVLSSVIADLIADGRRLSGLYHVGTQPIDKYDLLCRLNESMNLGILVEPDDGVSVDRTLLSERFWRRTGLKRPEWPEMIAGLAAESVKYEQWRRT